MSGNVYKSSEKLAKKSSKKVRKTPKLPKIPQFGQLKFTEMIFLCLTKL